MSKLSKGLITAHYINALKRIHGNQNRSNGFGGKVKPLGHFVSLMTDWQPATMLDYGCGKGAILAHLQSSYPNTVVEAGRITVFFGDSFKPHSFNLDSRTSQTSTKPSIVSLPQ